MDETDPDKKLKDIVTDEGLRSRIISRCQIVVNAVFIKKKLLPF